MLPAPTDPCHPDALAVPSPVLQTPPTNRAQPPGRPGFRPLALAGAVPLPGLEPWTCFGRLA